jgi:hypothetical protein
MMFGNRRPRASTACAGTGARTELRANAGDVYEALTPERSELDSARIGNVLHARLPVRQWRFDAAAYRRAPIAASGPALRGQPVAASWDPCLEKAMLDSGRGIEEEGLSASTSRWARSSADRCRQYDRYCKPGLLLRS